MSASDAQAAIHTASAAAAGVSASPIPFSDATLLIPIQTTMIMGIYKAYDREISRGLVDGAVKATTMATIGRSAAGNLLKLIPGVGSVVGGVINAGVAVGFTEFLGQGVARELEHAGSADPIDIIEVIRNLGRNFN